MSINSIALDMDVVENAITFDERSKATLSETMQWYHRRRESEQRGSDEGLAL